MKIRDVKAYVLETALTEPFAYSQAWYERRGACLVEIVGEDGNSGWGEAFGPARLTAPIVEFYMAVLQEPIEQHGGWVEIPQGPGLGIEIDRAALARFAV